MDKVDYILHWGIIPDCFNAIKTVIKGKFIAIVLYNTYIFFFCLYPVKKD